MLQESARSGMALDRNRSNPTKASITQTNNPIMIERAITLYSIFIIHSTVFTDFGCFQFSNCLEQSRHFIYCLPFYGIFILFISWNLWQLYHSVFELFSSAYHPLHGLDTYQVPFCSFSSNWITTYHINLMFPLKGLRLCGYEESIEVRTLNKDKTNSLELSNCSLST